MNIHLFMAFSRRDLLQNLADHYRPMGAILHLLTFADETPAPQVEPWIIPFVAPMTRGDASLFDLANAFIDSGEIVDDDYYVGIADDDGYEPGVFDAIRKMDDPVIFISMKRGYKIPDGLPREKRYGTETLIACPENARRGLIGGEQVIVKGSILKSERFDPDDANADGLMAERLKEKYPIRYEPYLYALFNLFQPGRWERGGIAFGCMTNHPARLDMALRQSEITGEIHFVRDPESATKGLNKLLGVMEAEGADVAVLTHQDMSFRRVWLPKVREQLAKLPDSWVVAGIIGKDMKGRIAGVFHDTRIPAIFNTADIHTFPQAACCFDECCILVNLHKGFRFDETLDGFDLYGTLCVLQAWEMGGTAWIIDSGACGVRVATEYGEMAVDIAYASHHCTLPFTWFPNEQFQRNYKWLHDRFLTANKIDTTVLGVSEELRFETSAA